MEFPSFVRAAPRSGGRGRATKTAAPPAMPFEGLPPEGALIEELSVLLALMLALAVVANLLFVG